MGHIHSAAMAEYAKDALETDKPWERWEFSQNGRYFMSLVSHPTWYDEIKYRRKPQVILINGHEVPEPHRTPLKYGEAYWTLYLVRGATSLRWEGDAIDFCYLENGFIHLTKEAAEKHFNALKSFTAQKSESWNTHTTKGSGAKQ